MTPFAELAVTTNFSFLRGGSHPEELVARGRRARPRRHRRRRPQHARRRRPRPCRGEGDRLPLRRRLPARLPRRHARRHRLADRPRRLGPPLPAAHPRQSPRREGRLPSRPRRPPRMGRGHDARRHAGAATWPSAASELGKAHPSQPLIPAQAGIQSFPRERLEMKKLGPRLRGDERRMTRQETRTGGPSLTLAALHDAFPGNVRLMANRLYGPATSAASRSSTASPRHYGVPLLAPNDVLYHAPERRPLQDVLSCIREHRTLENAGRLLEPNAERHLKDAAEMARLFRDYPEAIAEILRRARAARLLARRAPLRLSRRADRRCATPAGRAGPPHRGGRALPLSRRRAGEGQEDDRPRAGDHREPRLRALFPHRPRHRALRPRAGHPLPGPRLGGQFRRLLLPRHHRGEPRHHATSSSSASSRPSATSRPTSTSISSTSGARR